MTVETHIYDDVFFKNALTFEGKSARAFTRIIASHIDFTSVVDIGCGTGIYLKELSGMGKEVLGYDGAPAAIRHALIQNIFLHDLTEPLLLSKKYDLCMSIEVAEHLPESAVPVFIQSIINASDRIIFTAATPGQGSRDIGHINEQPHEYWVQIFKNNGYYYQKELSEVIRKELAEKDVIWWIVQNLMIFKRLV